MKTIQQTCGTCAGRGKIAHWKIISKPDDVYGMAEKVEEECCACGGMGYIEYAAFTVEEAQAILKHCGIIADENGGSWI